MSTYEILQSIMSSIPEDSRNISHLGFAILIFSSILVSIACAYLYLFFFDKNATGSKVYRAFPLIGPAITCIFLTVQFSLPLSLGLLGALSIVRFRTPIKEPEEIGFILLLIGCALCVATFNLSFAIILLVVAFAALWSLKYLSGFSTDSSRTSLVHIEASGSDQSNVVDDIKQLLASTKIASQVVSVNQRDDTTYLTLRINGKEAPASRILNSIQAEFPDAVVTIQST